MRLLLDTSTLIWWMTEPGKLSREAYAAIEQAPELVHISVVSLWEIEVKVSIGKLNQINDLASLVDSVVALQRFAILNLQRKHVHKLASLESVHKDPFDRMLICQAISEDLTLVSPDRKFSQYPVASLW